MTGRIHSFQSMGGADGPGMRYVVFMQGCPLSCAYCHNPDALDFCGGSEYSVAEVAQRVLRCKPYFGERGGVTVSGGEPLVQHGFVTELFSVLKGQGVHTALDTSGTCNAREVVPLLELTRLVICDIKFPTERQYAEYCSGSLKTVLEFLSATQDAHVPLWIRHVAVPGLTDTKADADSVVELASRYSNLEKIEFLPFRKLCAAKYEQLGLEFSLKNTPECSENTIEQMNLSIPEHLK